MPRSRHVSMLTATEGGAQRVTNLLSLGTFTLEVRGCWAELFIGASKRLFNVKPHLHRTTYWLAARDEVIHCQTHGLVQNFMACKELVCCAAA